MMSMRATLLALLLLFNVAFVSCSLVDDLRAVCPYSDFCTIPSLMTSDPSFDNVTSPCFHCFCDEECWAYGDCCPDLNTTITMNKGLSTKLECKPVYVENTYVNNTMHIQPMFAKSLPHYRVIDFCPEEFPVDHMTHKYCVGDPDFRPEYDDVVLVSDENSRIFKNKYCASCHGVTETKRWKMVINSCEESLDQLQLTLTELKYYVLNYCDIRSERPSDVALNGRTLTCDSQTCAGKDIDETFLDGCLNGPHMPFCKGKTLYKNALCFKCKRGSMASDNLCTHGTDDQKTIASFKLFLDTRQSQAPAKSQSLNQCGEAELYDHFKENCRRMYCPPLAVASYGTCMKMSDEISDIYLDINIIFHFGDQSFSMELTPNVLYNQSLADHYRNTLVEKFGFSGCLIDFLRARVGTGPNSNMTVGICVLFRFRMTESCNMEHMSEVLKRKASQDISVNWFLDGRYFELTGKVSFHDSLKFPDLENYQYLILGQSSHAYAVRGFFLCRYVTISLDEYNSWISKSGNGESMINLSKLSMTTQLYPDFYALSENQVAVCADTYFQRNGAQGNSQSTRWVIIAMSLLLAYYQSA